MIPPITIQLILAMLFGAAIGLERESASSPNTSSAGGIRTYTLISLLGALCGVFYTNNIMAMAIIVAVTFFAILLAYYAIGSYASKNFGMTTELAMLFTFLLGLLSVLNILSLQVLVAIFVVLALILSSKSKTSRLLAGINFKEVESFVSYAIVALVVLPFLPNIGYKLTDLPLLPVILESININLGAFASLELFNPQKIWFVVALITGIDVFGYTMSKIIGSKNSFALTSFTAGFISSTSTTQSLAQRSKRATNINHLVGAAVLANMASFLQMFALVGPLNGNLLASMLPSLFIMILIASVIAVFFFQKKEVEDTKEKTTKKEEKIFSLVPALKFAAILIAIKIITKVCLILFGQSGFIISSVIASFAGIDAVVVNLSEMAGQSLGFKFAVFTFLLVSATNLASKSVYSFLQGNRQFAIKFLASMAVITAGSFIGLLFI